MTPAQYRALQEASEALSRAWKRCDVHDAHRLPTTAHIRVELQAAIDALEQARTDG